MTEINTVIATIGWTIMFSLAIFFKKTTKENPEAFNVEKFFTTILFSAIIGTILAVSGMSATEGNYNLIATQYAVVALIVQNIVHTVYRKYKGVLNG